MCPLTSDPSSDDITARLLTIQNIPFEHPLPQKGCYSCTALRSTWVELRWEKKNVLNLGCLPKSSLSEKVSVNCIVVVFK